MKTTRLNSKLLVLPLSLALIAGAAFAEVAAVINVDQVRKILNDAGYAEVRDIERENNGTWEAEVRGKNGRWHDVHVVGTTGELLDDRSGRPIVTAAEITSKLEAAGYTRITDLDLDDALWEVEATAPTASAGATSTATPAKSSTKTWRTDSDGAGALII